METRLKNLSLKNKILRTAELLVTSNSSPEAPRPSLGPWGKLITSSRQRQGLGLPGCQVQLYGEIGLVGSLNGKFPFFHIGVGLHIPEAHVFCKEEGRKSALGPPNPKTLILVCPFPLWWWVPARRTMWGSTGGPGGWEGVHHGKAPCDHFHLPRSVH